MNKTINFIVIMIVLMGVGFAADFRSPNDINLLGNEIKNGSMNWTMLKNYPLSCPAGTFVSTIGDSVTCESVFGTNGGNFDVGGGNITNASVINGVYYVQAGNATDIQTKIDLANANGGGKVVIPKGLYVVNQECASLYSLCIKSNVQLIGSGIGSTVIFQDSGADTHVFGSGSTGEDYVTNFSIQDMTIDANKAEQTADRHNLRIINGDNGLFNNLELKNSMHHQFNVVVNNSKINNIWSYNAGSTGLSGVGMTLAGNNNIFTNIHVFNADYIGMQIKSSSYADNLIIDGFYIANSGDNGFEITARNNNLISNGIIFNSSLHGINVEENSTNNQFNNVVINYTGGIGIRTESNVNQTNFNNIFIDNVGNDLGGVTLQSVIYIQGDDTQFVNLITKNTGGNGNSGNFIGTDNIIIGGSLFSEPTCTDCDFIGVNGVGNKYDNQIFIKDGSASFGGIAFVSDPNTGIYRVTNDVMGFSAGGVHSLRVLTSGIQVGDGSSQKNITLTSPDGTEYSCGVANGGTFSCS